MRPDIDLEPMNVKRLGWAAEHLEKISRETKHDNTYTHQLDLAATHLRKLYYELMERGN